ncbi:MAG: aspartate aminotransferase family protein, partial [Chloroflexi bacterium]|nr:aspartate aminotransferase family protein [Chloroflexota bacterium]
MDTVADRTAQGAATHFIQPLHGSVSGEPRIIVSGKGVEITDSTGKTFIDSFAGLWNVNVGFGRAELAQAAYDQMTKIAYCSSYSGQATEPALKLVDRLLKLTYPNMDAVYLTSGGAESNESAFKTARYFWYRQGKPDKVKIVARMRSYHGTTIATMTATGQPAYWPMFGPKAPGFVHVEPTDQYRNPKTGREYAKALEDKILEEGPETVAAFIAEPVVGGAGLLVPPDDYFPAIREICDKYDVLLIADEVITGFGRTGKWFALEHWGVQPDIM